jgi:ADP-ribose pyrophosphatase YjhB (NUDIX family)
VDDDYYADIYIVDTETDTVVAVSDCRFLPENKAPGGMEKNGETPAETALRKAREETNSFIPSCTLVFTERFEEYHLRHSFVSDGIEGALAKGAEFREVDRNPRRQFKKQLVARWVPLDVFAKNLYQKQHRSFGAALAYLASTNLAFCERHAGGLMKQFPALEGQS